MSILKTNNIQLGQSSTKEDNIVLTVPAHPDGSFKIGKGVPGDSETLMEMDAQGNVTFSGDVTAKNVQEEVEQLAKLQAAALSF